jgi:hypothetical protein
MPFEKGNKHGKRFSSEYQPSGEAKSEGWVKKFALEDYKNAILDKSFKLINEKLDDEGITFNELISIFNKAVEMSGFKKDKIDTTVKTYSLFEEETERKADELIKRTKKADKK